MPMLRELSDLVIWCQSSSLEQFAQHGQSRKFNFEFVRECDVCYQKCTSRIVFLNSNCLPIILRVYFIAKQISLI